MTPASEGADQAPKPQLDIPAVAPLLRRACDALAADAITVAVRQKDTEQLLVCVRDGTVREATGSLSLGLVSDGPTKLAGGAGLLQAVECSSLLGFTPSGYLGAPFQPRRRDLRGGVAAWSKGERHWDAEDGTLLRQVADACAREVEEARMRFPSARGEL